jgi:hypothetical protein
MTLQRHIASEAFNKLGEAHIGDASEASDTDKYPEARIRSYC